MRFLRFHNCFFMIALVVFVVEVFIALFVHDSFIRPYLGDVIVVWFVYYFIRAFVNIPALYVAVFTLLFSFGVEIGQYFKLIHLLGLEKNALARIVIGTSFSWWDMVCYVAGFMFLFLLDKDLRKSH